MIRPASPSITAQELGIAPVLPGRQATALVAMAPTVPTRYRLVSWLFAGEAVREAAATRVDFRAGTQSLWNYLMMYEEVPGRPPLLLRLLLPLPVRTEGDKTSVGASIRCTYAGGELVKRITAVQPPHCLEFDVVVQRLGIEGCIRTVSGSYQMLGGSDATVVVLTTNYEAYLRPRWLWRRLERVLVGQLHRHILRGVSAAVEVPQVEC